MAEYPTKLIAATRRIAVMWLVVVLLAPGVLRGQEPPPGPPPPEPSFPEGLLPEELRPQEGQDEQGQDAEPAPRDLEAEIAEVDARLAALTGEAAGAVPEAEQARAPEVELLQRLRRVLQDLRLSELRESELAAERRRLEEQGDEGPGAFLGHEPPFTLDELDDVLDRRQALEESHALLARTMDTQESALETARDRSRAAEAAHERAQQELGEADPARAAELRRELRLLALEERVTREQMAFAERRLANDRAELELLADRERRLEEAAAWLRERLDLTPDQRRQALAGFEDQKRELRRTIEGLRLDQERAEDRWSQTAARQRLLVAEDRLQRLEALERAWEIRYLLLRGELTGQEELREARRTLAEFAADLEPERQRRESQLNQAEATVAELEARLGELAAGDPAASDLREELEASRRLVSLYRQDLERLDRDLARLQRPLSQLGEQLAEVHLGARVVQWWRAVASVWDYVVYDADGGRITVGKIVMALLLLTFGLWASRGLSRLFARRVLHRFRLAEGAVAAFQTLTFYFLVVAFFLWALNVVQIPLTLFTFLGGAVAIGVGFGSQNIINNFMSGLILMVERPVRVGDLIDLEGSSGRVEQIGLRSTRIRSGDNTHVILPNSHLLENRVLNWTLSDNVMRTDMEVGVAYGSDLGKVRKCLAQALKESERVLDSPPPEILFTEFGDNALVFRALFWTKVRMPLDQARAQSEVRFHADALFREAGVVVAFPQRDVHLDSLRPLEVRLRRGENERDEP